MKREWAPSGRQSVVSSAAARTSGLLIQPLESRVSVPTAITATPSAEMPQHSTGDKPLVSKPQLVFPGPASGTDSECDRTPPSRRVSLSAPLSQPLCQPEKCGPRAAQEVCYVAAGQPGEACGWRAFAPMCLQAFNTPQGFLLFLCVASFLQGMTVNGFINTVITSIERRYDLHSYQSGLIASSYDVAACLCLTFVSYFGGHGHKPRWLGWGVLVMGAGSLVFALPHFTAGRYEVQMDEVVGTCWANHSSTCKDGASGLSSYRLVFMLGQFLHGMGATPLYTLGVTYLDENVKSSYSPVYIATFYTAAILGPAAGYLVGGALLNIYTDISQHSIWLLLKNPTFILLCLAGATEATLIAGMSTFGPKFLESQFSLSASEAATLFGYLVVPAGGGGTFLGGFFVNKFKLRGSGIIKFCLLCTLVSLLASLIFLMHCPGVPMAGVTAGYNGSLLPEGHVELMAACNLHCGCQPEHYSPVCGSDGLMYYSPCYAGCLEMAVSSPGGQKVRVAAQHVVGARSRGGGWGPAASSCNQRCCCAPQVYRDCSCVPQNFSSGFGHATAGKCTSTCQRKPLLLVFIFVVIVFTFLSSIPALTATLRCVCDQQRSFALGIQWIVVRTLGSIPGPIAFGWVIDKACLLWQDQCGQQGSCFVYQNSAMSWYLLIAGLGYKVLGSIFFAIACFLYKSPPGSSDGLEASLPSQSSASDNPSDLQEAPSALQIQSDI
ncbi:solute carrier organic anion transporter family member 4A1 isoform X4 [Bos indicus]|uniref:Solute carrier organic anion transporter family member 4A1 isoform X4 n=1 Tax=Bos indicus TaxID=9915 RepID=A0ABM4TBJ6_BOSIN